MEDFEKSRYCNLPFHRISSGSGVTKARRQYMAKLATETTNSGEVYASLTQTELGFFDMSYLRRFIWPLPVSSLLVNLSQRNFA